MNGSKMSQHRTEVLYRAQVAPMFRELGSEWLALAKCDCSWWRLAKHGREAERLCEQHLQENNR